MKLERAQRGRLPAQYYLPLFAMTVNDGESRADEHVEERLDLAELLIVRPDETFFVRVEGETLDDASIRKGDILVVDRSVKPQHNDTVIAVVEGEFTLKVLHKSPTALRLVSRASALPGGIEIPFEVWGVVLWVIHQARDLA